MQPEAGQPDAQSLDGVLRAARDGDLVAFNTLVVLYQRQIYNLCYRTLGNAEDAADATQDAFLNAFRGLKAFHGSSSGVRAWLLRIAVNGCYDHLRRRQRRPTESLDAAHGGSDESEHDASVASRLPDPGPTPEQSSLSAETGRHIQAAIDRLSPEQRVTVLLCDVHGLSYEEVAVALSVELGTMKSRLSRARAQLRDLLTQQGEPRGSSERLQGRNP